MRKSVFLALLVLASVAQAGTVRGHIRSNGTYVAPHIRSAPDSTRLNNWSTKGNVNPYTGKSGTQPVFKPLGQKRLRWP